MSFFYVSLLKGMVVKKLIFAQVPNRVPGQASLSVWTQLVQHEINSFICSELSKLNN